MQGNLQAAQKKPAASEHTDVRTMSASFIEMLMLIHRKFFRGITTPVPLNQFAVLMLLQLEGHSSPKTVGDVLHISKQQMTSILEKLVDAGFITRATDPADRRRLQLSLTKRGADILDRQNDIVKRKFIESLDDLTEEERDDLARAIKMITLYVEKMRKEPRDSG